MRRVNPGNSAKAGEDMAWKKKPVNNTPYPDYVIETMARCFWPDIQTFFESEEGQREFEAWKEEQLLKKEKENFNSLAA